MFQPSAALKDAEARRRISELEERWQQSERQIGELQSEFSRRTETQERAMAAVEAEVAQLKEAAGGMAAQAALPARVHRAEVDIARLASEAAELRTAVFALKSWTAPEVDLLIIAEFPPLFEEFRRKRFKLLWRGSRDGFRAKEFHRRCDGRANTLTLIADIERNVFGDFTLVEWESRVWNGKGGNENNCYKGDDSLRSFLFTLRNPHCVPPRKFALRAERK
jgi:hypothetical protein